MMRKVTIIAVAGLALSLLVGAGGDRSFKADLSGAEEVPSVATDSSGRATFHVNKDETEIRFKLKIKNADDIFGAAGSHIHCGPAGANGPVVAFLAAPVPGGFDGTVEVKATLTDANIINPACGATIAELVDAMEAGGTYVNAHSSAHPGGEVRGQIGG